MTLLNERMRERTKVIWTLWIMAESRNQVVIVQIHPNSEFRKSIRSSIFEFLIHGVNVHRVYELGDFRTSDSAIRKAGK
jgi:hypothetical protein